MFNFRNLFKSPASVLIDEIKARGPIKTIDLETVIKPVEVPNVSKDVSNACYMVGMNKEGMTQIRVGEGYSITLSLNDAGVVQLIKLLAVNVENSYDISISPISDKDTTNDL